MLTTDSARIGPVTVLKWNLVMINDITIQQSHDQTMVGSPFISSPMQCSHQCWLNPMQHSHLARTQQSACSILACSFDKRSTRKVRVSINRVVIATTWNDCAANNTTQRKPEPKPTKYVVNDKFNTSERKKGKETNSRVWMDGEH